MIGLDTHVLVRLLTADEPRQLAAAKRLLAGHEGEQHAFFVNDMVRVALVWVLRRSNGVDHEGALLAVGSLLDNRAFAFENRERVAQALDLGKRKRHDFADAMIAVRNASLPCDFTASFDKATRGLPWMRVI